MTTTWKTSEVVAVLIFVLVLAIAAALFGAAATCDRDEFGAWVGDAPTDTQWTCLPLNQMGEYAANMD